CVSAPRSAMRGPAGPDRPDRWPQWLRPGTAPARHRPPPPAPPPPEPASSSRSPSSSLLNSAFFFPLIEGPGYRIWLIDAPGSFAAPIKTRKPLTGMNAGSFYPASWWPIGGLGVYLLLNSISVVVIAPRFFNAGAFDA